METGRVLLVHDQGEEGSTIVIQHAGKRVSVYGNLGLAAVKENDWVAAGERIGQLMRSDDSETSLLFFALKENDQYIDPVGVIPID
ncbi:Stage IV sporulation protein FA [compost metagenome]